MEETLTKPLRPWPITVLCVLGCIGAAFSIPQFFSPTAQKIGAWYLPYLGFSVALGLVCMLGLWKMKKWGAYTYAGLVILNQIVLYMSGLWDVQALVLPAVVVLLTLKYVPDMS